MSDKRRTRFGVTSTLAALGASFLVATAAAGAATVIHFQHESLRALEAQLSKHEVHALSFHPVPAPGHVHVSLNNGQHMTVVYAASDQASLIARARALAVPVAVATAKSKTTSKTTHHKLRYIAGGLVIVVIIVVTAVLLIDRRRRVNEAEPEPAAPAPSDSG
jgi:hypothetical protein